MSLAPATIDDAGRRQRRTMARRIGWGVADQGISSLSNFALGVLLARTLDASDFGAFGLAFVAFGFVISAVRGPSTDPLLVRFSGPADAAWHRAVAAASGCALLGGILAGAVSVGVGLLLPGSVGTGFVALGVVLPGILLQDSYRFAFFACGQGQRAFANDLLWGVLQIGGLGALLALDRVGVGSALLVFGGSATVAAVVAAAKSGVVPAPWLVRSWLVDHRSLGGRFLIENVSIGASRQIRVTAVGIVAGLAAVGQIRGAEILMGPFMILLSGVSQVSVPEARQVLAAAPGRLERFCFRLACVQASGAALWTAAALVVLPLGPGQLLLGDLWASSERLFVPMMIVLSLGCFQNAAAAGVRAMGASRRSLAAQLGNAVLTLLIGTGGAVLGGALGSCWGLALGTFLGALLWWFHLRRAVAAHLVEQAVEAPDPAARPEPTEVPANEPSEEPRLLPRRAAVPDDSVPPARGRVDLRNIQGLRGVAAFVVVFAHISGSDGIEQRLFGHSWMPWSNLPANTGVDLFFVISGLIMTVTTWQTFDALGSAPRFLWRRLTRILPLYWLINTAIVMLFVVSPTSVTWADGQSPGVWQSYLLLPRMDRMPLLVAWSLVFEMFFYLLFTVALLLSRRFFGWVIGTWAAATIGLHVAVGGTDNPYLWLVSSPLSLEFVLGVAIGYAVVRGWLFRSREALAVGLLGTIGLWAFLGASGWAEFPSHTFRLLGPGLVMSFVVYGAVGLELRRHRVCPRWLQALGDSSYSLYLVHVPAITALRFVLERYAPATPLTHAVLLLTLPVYAVAIGRLCYLGAERPMQRFFRRWRPQLARRSPAPSTATVVGSSAPVP